MLPSLQLLSTIADTLKPVSLNWVIGLTVRYVPFCHLGQEGIC